MRDVVVALALRTPSGKAPRGALRQTRPDTLGAAVVRALLDRVPTRWAISPARTSCS